MSATLEKVKTIFLDAVENHSQATWGDFLAQACDGDASLREQIEKLLKAHTESSLLEKGVVAAHNTFEKLFGTVAEGPGTQIGPYNLREQIGEGGFGVVYVAEQTHPVRRKVALKIIKPGMDSKEVIARFEAERQALALMDHPNVAKVLDAGATDTGRPYFVMELVRGVAITKFCDNQRLDTRERLQLFINVCLAVHHAHQKGIIHRDIKPSNVMVTLSDGKPIPKVIDFGVSKALSQLHTEHSIYTAYGQLIGTPLYMAPEQAELSMHDVDTRSDVYSLGVLLYELLTGLTPFDKKTLHDASFDEVRRIIREVEPPRPSARVSTLDAKQRSTISGLRRIDTRRLSRTLQGELDWIIMKALEKDRNRRYGSSADLATDIERHLSYEAIAARPPSVVYRLRKFAGRHRVLMATSIAVFSALVIGLAVALQERSHATTARELAEQSVNELQIKNEQNQALLYAADIGLAARSLDEGDVAQARQLLDRHSVLDDASDGRGIEWYFLKRKVMRPSTSEKLSGEPLYGLSLSSDRKLLAVAGADAVIRILDSKSLTPKIEFDADQIEVNGLAFTKDAQRIVTSGDDGTIRVWHVDSGSLLQELRFGSEKAYQVLIDDSGTRLIVCGETPEVRVFDFQSGECVATLLCHERPVEDIALSPDGNLLACASSDGRRSVWDWRQGRRLYRSAASSKRKTCIAFTADGQHIVDGGLDGILRVTRVRDFQWRHQHRFPAPIQSLSASPQGTAVAVGTRDGVVRLVNVNALIKLRGFEAKWPASSEEREHVWSSHQGRVYDLEWVDSKSLLSVGDRGRLSATWTGLGDVVWHIGPVFEEDNLCATPDGRFIAAATLSRLSVFDRTNEVMLDLRAFPGDATWTSVTIEPNGRHLVATTSDGRVCIGKFPNLASVSVTSLSSKAFISQVSFSADGHRLLFICRPTDQLHVVSFPTFETVRVASVPDNENGALSPDGRYLAANEARNLQVVDVVTGRVVATSPRHHVEAIREIQFTPNGQSIVTMADDRTIKIWNWQDKLLPELVGAHGSGLPSGLVVTADGRTIITSSESGELMFWNVATRQKLFRLTDHQYRRLWLSGDNRILFTLVEGERLAWANFGAAQEPTNLYQ